jgi:hypothetical protein
MILITGLLLLSCKKKEEAASEGTQQDEGTQETSVEVPVVAGLPFDKAVLKLKEEGLEVKEVGPKPTLDFNAGEVIRQDPEALTTVEAGSTVTLTVAGDSVKVPDVTGLNIQQATQMMSDNMLFPKVAGGKENVSGKVVSTSPEADTVVLKKTDVIISLQAPVSTDTKRCYNAVQGKIAWDYKGSKRWNPDNINRLCKGATNTDQPARCFDQVMHGGVNWGGGTKWQWSNAIDLCEGSKNASATVQCFKSKIAQRKAWKTAIASCD